MHGLDFCASLGYRSSDHDKIFIPVDTCQLRASPIGVLKSGLLLFYLRAPFLCFYFSRSLQIRALKSILVDIVIWDPLIMQPYPPLFQSTELWGGGAPPSFQSTFGEEGEEHRSHSNRLSYEGVGENGEHRRRPSEGQEHRGHMPPASWGRDERQFKRGMMKRYARGEVVQETTSPRSRELHTHPWKMGLSGEIWGPL